MSDEVERVERAAQREMDLMGREIDELRARVRELEQAEAKARHDLAKLRAVTVEDVVQAERKRCAEVCRGEARRQHERLMRAGMLGVRSAQLMAAEVQASACAAAIEAGP